MDKRIFVSFSNKQEIRHGSPYMMAELHITGIELNLPNNEWQDKFAISNDEKWLVLVNFDLSDNTPGFVFYIIDLDSKQITTTERYFGLLNDVAVKEGRIIYDKFLYDKDKSQVGKLCCNYRGEITL